MDSKSSKIKFLLQSVELVANKYSSLYKATGEQFNLMDVFNISTDELKHSMFLRELLDPTGCHGQGDLYLRLFIELLISNMKQIQYSTSFFQ